MRIALVRHAPVRFSPGRWIWPSEVRAVVAGYNVARLRSTEVPLELKGLAQSASHILASSLARSICSAKLLARDQEVIIDHIYDEAALPLPSWPLPLLPVRVWFLVLRVLWFLNLADSEEPKAKAQLRARAAAERLVEYSRPNKLILLVGHGIFMALISQALKDLGWRRQGTIPRKPWSACCYVPPESVLL